METRKPIEALAAEVIEALKKLNYAYNTVCGIRASFNRICAFARERNEQYFSEELGQAYLKDKYGCTTNYYLEPFPRNAKQAIRSVRLLGDYQLHGVVIRRIVKKKGYVKPPQFEEMLTAYEKECEANEYSLRGMRTRLQRLFFFVNYLALRNVMNAGDITPDIISDYVISICPKHEKKHRLHSDYAESIFEVSLSARIYRTGFISRGAEANPVPLPSRSFYMGAGRGETYAGCR